ncbi:MAG: SDR family NAD(P)-dependent oxidoreductase, partial [Ilumatobacteraceae bacterium]
MKLEGRTVVITGGSQGIGEKLAAHFASAGARVLLVARSEERLAAVACRIGGEYLIADLADPAQVDALVNRCVGRMGHVDIWVNNAGVETRDAFVHVPADELRTLVRVNVESTMVLTRHAVAHMLRRGSGHLVQVSSIAGAVPFPGLAAYSGTKAAITQFTEALRLELKGQPVGLTVVAPGPVNTKMWDRIDNGGSWATPALRRFRRLLFLPKVDPDALARDVVSAVCRERGHVRPKWRFAAYHWLNGAPARLVRVSLLGVRHPPLRVESGMHSTPGIWATDNPPSRRWTLYTRGNVGEVFPEVVLPLTWKMLGGHAEIAWRRAFEQLGLLMPGDLDPDEPMVILGVFGGYCYINASYVRLLGVRAPGGTVEAIDTTFFGESDAPPYAARTGDRNLRSSARLLRTALSLLGAKDLPELRADKSATAAYVATYPGDGASDEALYAHLVGVTPLFERLFQRHIFNTFAVALVSGALVDLAAKAGHANRVVTLLGGIGDVESAAPSAAMWALSRDVDREPAVARVFDAGANGLAARLDADAGDTQWMAKFRAFLDEFGSRGPNEWDLGSDPWAFRPDIALAAIHRMRTAPDDHEPGGQTARLAAERAVAADQVAAALNPIERFQFRKALAATMLYSQARERSKTTVIRAIHSARRAQAELARRIAAKGGPSERWLTCLYSPDEFVEALSDPRPFEDLIDERRRLHGRLSELVPPFIVEGAVPPIDRWEPRSRSTGSPRRASGSKAWCRASDGRSTSRTAPPSACCRR